MTNAKDKQEKQEELKSCPVAAALAPVRQLQKGEQVSALIFEGGGTKGAAYAGVVKALDAAGLVKDVKHFAGASAGAMTAAILAAGHDGPKLAKFIKEAPWEKLMKNISYFKAYGLASQFALRPLRSRPWRRAAARPWSATSSTTCPPRCRRGTPTTRCCFEACCHACQLPTPRRRDESHNVPLYNYNRSY